MKLKGAILAGALAAGAFTAMGATSAQAVGTSCGTSTCGTQWNFYSNSSRTQIVGFEIVGCGPVQIVGQVTSIKVLQGAVSC